MITAAEFRELLSTEHVLTAEPKQRVRDRATRPGDRFLVARDQQLAGPGFTSTECNIGPKSCELSHKRVQS